MACLAKISLAALALLSTACTALSGSPDIRASFSQALADYNSTAPSPPSCDSGYFVSRDGYVLALAAWATSDGLRQGDKIYSVNGVRAETPQDRIRGFFRPPTNNTLSLQVFRAESILDLSMRCVDARPIWATYRRVLEAGASGNWDACDGAINQYVNAKGFEDASMAFRRYQCIRARNLNRQGPGLPTESSALYRATAKMIEQARYEPGRLQLERGAIVANAEVIRGNGLPSLAAELESLLAAATSEAASRLKPDGSGSGERMSPRPSSARPTSRGTGFLVRSNGVLLTAFHVVQDAHTISVSCPGLSKTSGSLMRSNRSNDLALLQTGHTNVPHLSLARQRSIAVGDRVFTIGFPATELLGVEPKFSDGSISALTGPGDERALLQMTVPVQPGSSGGPLLSESGVVVGIVTSTAAVSSFLNATGTLPQSVNWAVKGDYAALLFDEPDEPPAPIARAEAIALALKATCLIEASR